MYGLPEDTFTFLFELLLFRQTSTSLTAIHHSLSRVCVNYIHILVVFVYIYTNPQDCAINNGYISHKYIHSMSIARKHVYLS